MIDAGMEITLKAGGSFIKIDPSGVTITGANIRLNSGGSPGQGAPAARGVAGSAGTHCTGQRRGNHW
ncbi:hypothetical protein ULF88_19875 [Halopseudomonas pachastrellae]|nr:hypothetical protein [Halopseudomonas pachastrellae]